jgi:multiple sugar transport system substrate-binding protein
MKKRVNVIIVLLVIGSLSLSSCGAFEGYGRTKVTWFIGFGLGALPEQIKIEKQVVDEFNKSQDKIWLVLDIVESNAAAFTALKQEIDSGNAPDIIGPIGWSGSNAFYGQWLDMTPYIKEVNYDTSIFDPALVKFYQTEEGQVGLPFTVYPAVVYYNKAIFDRAGLAYPPARYGEKYKLPDGIEIEWSWDTLTRIGKLLTLDKSGKNATQIDFDRENIVQYGYLPEFQDLPGIGTFWGAGRIYETHDGRSIAHIPPQWTAAWKWYFDGMWGPEPFIPIGRVLNDKTESNGDSFGYGIVAMAVAQLWYSNCCLHLPSGSWDMAALPSYQGQVHGHIDADTFRILKGTQNPKAAFEVIKYLIGPASAKLLDAYGGVPGLTEHQDAFFSNQKTKFPGITNWDVVKAGLAYPDAPSAAAYMPYYEEAYSYIQAVNHKLFSDRSVNVDSEVEKLEVDLQNLFDKK